MIFLIYVFIGLISSVPIYIFLKNAMDLDSHDGAGQFVATAITLLLIIIWPIALTLHLFGKSLNWISNQYDDYIENKQKNIQPKFKRSTNYRENPIDS